MKALSEATVIAGKYRLERELATGGMGAVWVARHLALDDLVAVKFMSAALADPSDARVRFAREARVAARLRGPHVVEVLDHGVDGDLPYLVMELLQGENLGDRLKRRTRLPLATVATIAAQAARALTRAHRAAIVHRDLKPANIFLAQVDGEEIVKLLDFGIAKVLSAPALEATRAEVLMGSPQYMAPEQARGSTHVDHRADLWSFGAILFRALTGVPAFEGASAVDVIVQICTSPIPLASRVAPDLPRALDGFFLRALDRDPARRFASAREMADALASIAGLARPSFPSDTGSEPPPPTSASSSAIVDRRAALYRALERPRLEDAEIDDFLDRALGESPARPGSPRAERAPESTVPNHRALRGRGGLGRLGLAGPEVACLADQGFDALRRGDTDGARRAWQRALTLDPTNRPLALNLRRLDALGAAGRS